MTSGEVDALAGQGSLFDEIEPSKKPKGRLSFFKAIQLKAGNLAAMYEDVYFAVLDDGGEGCALTSPAYGDTELTAQRNFKSRFQPHEKAAAANGRECYGHSPGQIGALKDEAPR